MYPIEDKLRQLITIQDTITHLNEQALTPDRLAAIRAGRAKRDALRLEIVDVFEILDTIAGHRKIDKQEETKVKPTEEQIKAEIKTLRDMQPKGRHYSLFGTDNQLMIKIQTEVLEHNYSENAIYDRYERHEDELSNALDARQWMDGDEEMSPSDSWSCLVKE